jgi:hypothetical protein
MAKAAGSLGHVSASVSDLSSQSGKSNLVISIEKVEQ